MSRLGEEFVSELFNVGTTTQTLEHAYDPLKAKEYYLRTRELKGRRAAAAKPTPNSRTVTVQVTAAKRAAMKKAASAKRKKEIEARVKALKGRLAKLKKVLADLVKQAKARSGVKTAPAKKTTSAPTAKPKSLTTAQKRDAAKRAEAYRKENEKPKTPDAEAKQLEAKIKQVQERIAKMKKQIADAKKKSSSKTASKGR